MARTSPRSRRVEYGDLIGLPYGWRESGDAYDCFTLIAEVFARLGWRYSIPIHIREQFPDGVIRAGGIDPDIWIPIESCTQIGDVALLRGPRSAERPEPRDTARHCAIMVGQGLMLQATQKLGVHAVRWRVLRPFSVACVRYSGVLE